MRARIETAQKALAAVGVNKNNDMESDIVDLVTDLLHLAHNEGMDYKSITTMAEIHIKAELEIE